MIQYLAVLTIQNDKKKSIVFTQQNQCFSYNWHYASVIFGYFLLQE